MVDDIDVLQRMELKEAFDEFDKVKFIAIIQHKNKNVRLIYYTHNCTHLTQYVSVNFP